MSIEQHTPEGAAEWKMPTADKRARKKPKTEEERAQDAERLDDILRRFDENPTTVIREEMTFAASQLFQKLNKEHKKSKKEGEKKWNEELKNSLAYKDWRRITDAISKDKSKKPSGSKSAANEDLKLDVDMDAFDKLLKEKLERQAAAMKAESAPEPTPITEGQPQQKTENALEPAPVPKYKKRRKSNLVAGLALGAATMMAGEQQADDSVVPPDLLTKPAIVQKEVLEPPTNLSEQGASVDTTVVSKKVNKTKTRKPGGKTKQINTRREPLFTPSGDLNPSRAEELYDGAHKKELTEGGQFQGGIGDEIIGQTRKTSALFAPMGEDGIMKKESAAPEIDIQDTDAQPIAQTETPSAKKPWWKFWGRDKSQA